MEGNNLFKLKLADTCMHKAFQIIEESLNAVYSGIKLKYHSRNKRLEEWFFNINLLFYEIHNEC